MKELSMEVMQLLAMFRGAIPRMGRKWTISSLHQAQHFDENGGTW